MENIIKKHIPSNWECSSESVNLSPILSEYENIAAEVQSAFQETGRYEVKSIKRVQNLYHFGQLLLREQLLLTNNPGTNYYRVRRYVTINKNYLDMALKHNLDYRRCGSNEGFTFKKRISSVMSHEILLAVQVVTANPHMESIKPENSLEYYIEYIIEIL